ncbi:hypothetical protein [Streptomyces sp. NPDC058595]|uniref:hypothetical protein n=1 Tax=Streptomyces sp. NPDC058595 TaxID=3346550 RepID=UPI0036656A08
MSEVRPRRYAAESVDSGSLSRQAAVTHRSPIRCVVAVQRQGCHLDALLAGGAERLPAGGEDGEAARGGEQVGDGLGAGVHHPFAAVEYEQCPPVGEPFAERFEGHPQGVVGESDGVGDGDEQQPLVGERRQVGPPHTVGEPLGGSVRRRERESALVDAAGAGECGRSVCPQGAFDGDRLGRASDETGRLFGKVSHHGGQSGPVGDLDCHPW